MKSGTFHRRPNERTSGNGAIAVWFHAMQREITDEYWRLLVKAARRNGLIHDLMFSTCARTAQASSQKGPSPVLVDKILYDRHLHHMKGRARSHLGLILPLAKHTVGRAYDEIPGIISEGS